MRLDLADLRTNAKAPRFGRGGVLAVRYGKAASGGPPQRRTVLLVPEMDWVLPVLEHWLTEVRPAMQPGKHPALWITERRGRVSVRLINAAFNTVRDAAGLDPALDLHCLRRLLSALLLCCVTQRERTYLPLPPTRLLLGASSSNLRRALPAFAACPAYKIATPTPPHTASAERRRPYVTHLIEFGYPVKFVQDQVGHKHASTTSIYTGVSDEYRNQLLQQSLRGRLRQMWGEQP